jgi:DNA invertase Pin-like site-specific DNA recombinase
VHQIIKITEDPVSGTVSSLARAGLGPWLRRPLLDTWTVLAVHSLDRLTRRIDDFDVLWALLETERKILVSITEDIDFSTPGGLLEARRRVRLAQAELELIRRRAKAAYDAIVANGQYPGKQFPFGYIPARREPTGWILIPHPLYADVVREIADRLIVGESLGAICRWLNRTGIPTPRNAVREYKRKKPLDADAQWMPTSLTKILKSPNIVGQVTVNGIAVTRAEPLIDVETWEYVKQFLARNAARTGPKVNQSPLLGVVFCMLCEAPMYIATASYTLASGEAKKYRYYCCTAANRKRGCNAQRVDAGEVERQVGDRLIASIGDRRRDPPGARQLSGYSRGSRGHRGAVQPEGDGVGDAPGYFRYRGADTGTGGRAVAAGGRASKTRQDHPARPRRDLGAALGAFGLG